MDRTRRTAEAGALLGAFAERTGLAPVTSAPRRYLWTDAFAVATWLELHRRGEPKALALALRLIEAVHETLGRHRPDDRRRGWISGLSETEGREHPTRGGLRIGKPSPERLPEEPFDQRLEWERDGQYFHYATKWMHALTRAARVGGEPRCLRWALEHALASHRGFVLPLPAGAGKRMIWKASIDLSRPLVNAQGQHDPLDGLLSFCALRAELADAGDAEGAHRLGGPIADFRALCAGARWATADPLGLGGLLLDALRLTALVLRGYDEDRALLEPLLRASEAGLVAWARGGELALPASRRLAFREAGLALGLHALEPLAALVEGAGSRLGAGRELAASVERLRAFAPLAEGLEEHWLRPEQRVRRRGGAQEDIDEVMLATSLVPEGMLGF